MPTRAQVVAGESIPPGDHIQLSHDEFRNREASVGFEHSKRKLFIGAPPSRTKMLEKLLDPWNDVAKSLSHTLTGEPPAGARQGARGEREDGSQAKRGGDGATQR